MRVLLMMPPVTVHKPDPKRPRPNVPLGLAYLAAYLERSGHEVRVLDALAQGIQRVEEGKDWLRFGLGEHDISECLTGFQPDVVGISCMFTVQAGDSHRCAEIAKKALPGAPVVFGGAHASAAPHLVLRDNNVDIVVRGEGEITFAELVERIGARRNLDDVVGTSVRGGDGSVRNNPPRPLITDLDSLPYPARHLLPMDVYLSQSDLEYGMRFPQLYLSTSRGCSANCAFCSIRTIWGSGWRGRTAANVGEELELLVKTYGAREISFVDENMSVDRQRMSDICDEIVRRKLNIKWCTDSGVGLWTMDPDLLKKMKKSGCYRIAFGLESGNPEVQKYIGKAIKLERAKSIVLCSNRLGMWTIASFVIGLPYEKEDQIRDTIRYAIECGVDLALFYVLYPLPGTRAYEDLLKEGLIAEDEHHLAAMLARGGTDTKYLTRDSLKRLQREAHSSFLRARFKSYMNPMRILRKVRSWEDLRYACKIGSNALRGYLVIRRSDPSKFHVKSYLRRKDAPDERKHIASRSSRQS